MPLLYVEHEDGIALAATNFGGKQHPGWSFNLEADPTARVAIREQERVMAARRASDGEIARLWPRFCDIWPAYDAYRDRTTRNVKVFLLDPRP